MPNKVLKKKYLTKKKASVRSKTKKRVAGDRKKKKRIRV
jgi:hypothetical protein